MNPAWQLKDNRLRIAIGTLGKVGPGGELVHGSWVDGLEKTLQILAEPAAAEDKKKR